MGLRPLEIFYFFQCGDRLYTSESDVHRRQILTYKDSPPTKPGITTIPEQQVKVIREREDTTK